MNYQTEKYYNTMAVIFSLIDKFKSEGITPEFATINVPVAARQIAVDHFDEYFFTAEFRIEGYRCVYTDSDKISYTVVYEEAEEN